MFPRWSIWAWLRRTAEILSAGYWFIDNKSNPAVIRIASGTHYQAWGQEYIILRDRARATQQKAGLSFHISIETKGICDEKPILLSG
jgi:hypothetical protein